MGSVERRLLAREATLATVVAASLAAVLLWASPPGVDWAAHAYQRTFLIQHGFAVWNNYWYAGRYSFVTYSLLYYPLAALLGIRVLAARLDRRRGARVQHGRAAPVGAGRPGSRAGRSPCSGRGSCFSAAFPFALARLVRAARALGRCSRGAAGASRSAPLLTLAASPLAFRLPRAGPRRARRSTRSLRHFGFSSRSSSAARPPSWPSTASSAAAAASRSGSSS